ncbi:serpin family protein [Nonomuraea sp. NPDC050556]|uniref:serpin family protein n=1 Tax=Nonomuraea sp. NPDC050556 TaxID=3364369 RepID=UPI0037ABADCF
MRRLLAVLLIVSTAACGASAQFVGAAGVKREIPRDPPVEETVRGVTAFGHALLSAVAKPGENVVLSPLSIASAYGMARAGAVGATAAELDQVFGFPAKEGPHAAFNALTEQVERSKQVSVANALFPQQGSPINQDFLRTLAAQYGTGVQTVDFTAGNAVDVINDWADRNTAGRIKKVFEQLDPRTKLVLANAVHLKADWLLPFGKEPTQNATFTRHDGSTLQTPTMHAMDRFAYAAGKGWQAVELPYQGGQLAMWVLVPSPGGSPGDLLKPETLEQVARGLKGASVDLKLPKWDFATTIDLMPPMEQLGLRDSDFSGIAPGLFISQAIHRANITVDERGTEAAAVTALAFEASGPGAMDATVRADHPFAFAIVHKPTRTPLFVGQVADPGL